MMSEEVNCSPLKENQSIPNYCMASFMNRLVNVEKKIVCWGDFAWCFRMTSSCVKHELL